MTTKYSKSRSINSLDWIVTYEIISSIEDDREIFGLRLEMTKNDNGDKILIENETIKNLTYSQRQIRELFSVLYNNSVTPRELVYIVDDYITLNPDFIFDEFEVAYNLEQA